MCDRECCLSHSVKKKKKEKKTSEGCCFLSLNFFPSSSSSSSSSAASRLKPFLGFVRGAGEDSVLPGERGLDAVFVKEWERSQSDGNGPQNNSCVRACASVAVRAALL